MDPETFSGFSGCTLDCAPTLGMMSVSEAPTEMVNTNWGAGSNAAVAKPYSYEKVYFTEFIQNSISSNI